VDTDNAGVRSALFVSVRFLPARSPRPLCLVTGFEESSYQQWIRIESGIIERTRIIQVHMAKWTVSEDVDKAGQSHSEIPPHHL